MTGRQELLAQRPDPVPSNDPRDVLSDVLRAVRLTGSMLFLVEARTPWMTQAPATRSFAKLVLPSAQHLISYHVITAGTCWGGLAGAPPHRLECGDVLVVPHGDPYFLSAPADAMQTYSDDDAVSFFRRMAAGELPVIVNEGQREGEKTEFICGFLGCDIHPFNPILAVLPPVMRLRGATAAGGRLGHLVDFALVELREPSAGTRDVLLRLSELMFVEVVRAHAATAPAQEPGWLAGLRDPLIARALGRIHGQPAEPWTLQTLAASANTSRTTLTERFVRYVGQPPMQYLNAWRMQLATRLLADGHTKVRAVAEAVGYDSEAAFSRAFKKHTGRSPANWRQG